MSPVRFKGGPPGVISSRQSVNVRFKGKRPRVPDSVLNILVSQVMLNGSGIVAIIRQLVACAVSQHVRVYGISIFADSPAPFLFFCGEDRAIVCTFAQSSAGPTFGFSTQDVDS